MYSYFRYSFQNWARRMPCVKVSGAQWRLKPLKLWSFEVPLKHSPNSAGCARKARGGAALGVALQGSSSALNNFLAFVCFVHWLLHRAHSKQLLIPGIPTRETNIGRKKSTISLYLSFLGMNSDAFHHLPSCLIGKFGTNFGNKVLEQDWH